MPSTIDALKIRRRLGRDRFFPAQTFGPDGWRLVGRDMTESVVVSAFPWDHDATGDGSFESVEWIHASWAGPDRVPTYEEMRLLHYAVWGDTGYSYAMQVPRKFHINIHPHALHLWGRADGLPVMPDFGSLYGRI